jgi:hypothetical protein
MGSKFRGPQPNKTARDPVMDPWLSQKPYSIDVGPALHNQASHQRRAKQPIWNR